MINWQAARAAARQKLSPRFGSLRLRALVSFHSAGARVPLLGFHKRPRATQCLALFLSASSLVCFSKFDSILFCSLLFSSVRLSSVMFCSDLAESEYLSSGQDTHTKTHKRSASLIFLLFRAERQFRSARLEFIPLFLQERSRRPETEASFGLREESRDASSGHNAFKSRAFFASVSGGAINKSERASEMERRPLMLVIA